MMALLCQQKKETIMRVDGDSAEYVVQVPPLRPSMGQADSGQAGALPKM